ncbi:coiled-coil domain-containing protein 40-like isoform X2 [Syngnathoides biaculeatus]|uniref:coiled-coil domain-containing protein 40-like isoform X2 n=1 Tax=Syngnathoides biaculeatus TaxID=300417 RepID=UPI002ADE93BA|nr:coiled-coil domain-containing protein 40-like isoform X2 [Syngnathoides biaculeatus]
METAEGQSDDVGGMEEEHEETEQHDGNDQAANDAPLETAEDQSGDVGGTEAEHEETEQQGGNDQAENDETAEDQSDDVGGIEAGQAEPEQQDGNEPAANNAPTETAEDQSDDVGGSEAGQAEPEQQDGNEPAANNAPTETAEDQLDNVGGIEAGQEETEQQNGNDPVANDAPVEQGEDQSDDVRGMQTEAEQQDGDDQAANMSPFLQDQPGSEPEDVGPQPDSSGAEEDLDVHIQSEQENASQVLSPPSLMNVVDKQEIEDPVTKDNEEEDFVVLDATHPLVAKTQAALKNQLIKEFERLTRQLKEEVGLEKEEAIQTKELYVELFREQERLKRLQTRLDGQQKTKALAEAKHRQVQDELKAMKSCHSNTTKQCTKTRTNASKLQTQLDKLKLHVNFTQEVSENLHSNVKATSNATRKVATRKSKAEDQKLKQDMYVERLTKELDRLTEQMDLYEVQTKAQAETTLATKEALSEAEMQMESLAMAQKQLLQQWNSSLLNMRRQDEEFGVLQEAACMAEHQVIVLDREIEGNKKSLSELQEKSETLTMMLNCAQMDCEVVKKMISQKQTQHETLQAQYSTYLRALGQTECTLADLTKEDSGLQVEVTDQRRKLEKNKNKHLELDNRITTKMLQKLMDNKAAQYYQRLTNKKASLKKEKFFQLWQLESSVMAAALESNVINEKLENLSRTQKELDEEIRKYNKVVASNQTNSSSIDALIAQKQTTIANINKKIDLIAARTGHEDLSPLQIKVEAIKTQIDALSQKIKNEQQLWLKHQGTLMGLTLEIQAHNKEYNKLQTKYTVICQKKIYLERQLEVLHREESDVEKSNKMLQRDLLKLNTLLSKNAQLRHALEQENAVMETEFLHKLKEAERDSIEMEAKLEKTQEEKEKLLSSLVEAERQIMLWEKKTHVMKETRLVVQEGEEEIQIMRDDVHRMERWLSLLVRQREQLLRDSIAVVERRGYIIERNEVMARSTNKPTTKGELNLMNDGLRRKIKEIHKFVKEYDQEIKELQEGQEEFQNKAKKIQEMIDGTPSTTASLEAVLQVEAERVHVIRTIIHRVWVEMPKYQGGLWKVLRSLAEHAESEEGGVNSVG